MSEVQLLTPEDVAARLGCSTKTLLAHVRAGDIEPVVIGAGTKKPRRRFTEQAVAEFLIRRTSPRAADEPLPPKRNRSGTDTVPRRTRTFLTPKLVDDMRARAAAGEGVRAISKALQVPERVVWKVILSSDG